MNIVEIITLFFVGFISLALAGVAYLLITGKGFLFQIGTDRTSNHGENDGAITEKEFIGKSILLVAFATPLLAFSVILDMLILVSVYISILLLNFLVAIIFIMSIKMKNKD